MADTARHAINKTRLLEHVHTEQTKQCFKRNI